MKIIIEIPDEHAPDALRLLGDMMTELRREKEEAETAGGADWSPMNPPEPLTAAPELPMPELIPNLPPLPEGKSRWAYLGTFPETDIETEKAIQFPTRKIRWFSENKWEWIPCWSLNGPFHHIEAI